ncbi:hypothetical protein GOBAR_DD02187 [Gossypium barbadense]|nr:hypothetical protein GOBAR_DD02187 [Gossypium barbadense]
MASHIHFQTSPYLIPETSSQPLVVIPMLSLRVPWDIRIQPAIPKGVRNYVLNFDTRRNHSSVLDFNPCSYGFVVEDGAYNFSVSDLSNGNPYLSYGCQDINKCKTLKPCNETATCDNVAGSYYCSCPEGFEGDGQKNGKGCSPKVKSHQSFPTLLVALGIGILFSLLCSPRVYLGLRQRKLNKMKQEYFSKMVGFCCGNTFHDIKNTVRQLNSLQPNSRKRQTTTMKVESLDEEVKVLFTKDCCLMVAVLPPKSPSLEIKAKFNNSLIIVLSQINHRNVVKLLGCCLETQVPLLVYEYVSNGSVFDHLHNADHESFISWEARLKIATEAAEALSYLHSAASPPIIHRDVKLANILLDENYTAKVSDFGASRLVPSNKEQITTLVRGTLGYLDPEYFQTSQLTEKSDVYSFGVVLIELLTGLKALSFERPEHERNLTLYFIAVMKEERLLDITDGQVLHDNNIEQLKKWQL